VVTALSSKEIKMNQQAYEVGQRVENTYTGEVGIIAEVIPNWDPIYRVDTENGRQQWLNCDCEAIN
jgi:hypothetical protein